MDLWYSQDKWVAFIFWQLWTFADIKCQQPNKITLKPQQKQHKSEFFHALVAPKLLSLPLGPTLASREWSCTIKSSLIIGSWLAETRIWNNIPVPPLEINTPILRPLPVTQNSFVFFHILPNFKSNYLTIEKDKPKLLTNSQQLIENTQDVQSGLNILGVLEKTHSTLIKPSAWLLHKYYLTWG